MGKNKENAIETKFISMELSALEMNEGQLQGLPANPREIINSKMELLKANLQQYPEMLTLRGLLVYPLNDDKYIIIGGNMRYLAMSELGFKTAPCIVIPKETTIDQLKAYSILDNNSFGKWNWDMLANEWDAAQLTSWGTDLPIMESEINTDEFFDSLEGDDEDKGKGEELTISIPDDYADQKEDMKRLVETALSEYSGIKVK